jgi:hypothetical protein
LSCCACPFFLFGLWPSRIFVLQLVLPPEPHLLVHR